MEILLNGCYGGFGVSEKALDLYNKRTGKNETYISGYERCYRTDPILIDIVKELGEEANSGYSNLYVDEVPDGYDYWIEEYDGIETLHTSVTEQHLRDLIRLGNEDDIVAYVMNAG
jgi:hypothetical protein